MNLCQRLLKLHQQRQQVTSRQWTRLGARLGTQSGLALGCSFGILTPCGDSKRAKWLKPLTF
eukprot:4424849-Amphidinium_carterae.2